VRQVCKVLLKFNRNFQTAFQGAKMNRAIFGGLAVSALLIGSPFGTASAADLPVKSYAPAPMPVAPSWTACYVGGNVGEAWVQKDVTFDSFSAVTIPVTAYNTASGTGWAGGGQIGCDYQVNSAWVVGARGMWDWGHVSGTTTATGSGVSFIQGTTAGFTTNSIETATVRAGYLLTPVLMVYGLGGVASVHDKYSLTDSGVLTATASDTRTGWNLGAGVAWMFNPNWDLWFEYDYMNFGNRTVGFTGQPPTFSGTSFTYGITQTVQEIILGVDYRFGAAR
jgi:outer membrane immunogenic protein